VLRTTRSLGCRDDLERLKIGMRSYPHPVVWL
jgi:hypothetical protein